MWLNNSCFSGLLCSVENEDEYDGLDPEIELEMEAFIEEIEEHLMLQDFDPELHQED